MDFEQENKKRSIWRDVLLFSIGILILSFMPKLKNDEMPEAKDNQLWRDITSNNDFKNWDYWTGYEGFYEAQSPNGTLMKLHVNNLAKEATEIQTGSLPENPLIVKENSNSQKAIVAITPVHNTENYHLNSGEWFWANTTLTTK